MVLHSVLSRCLVSLPEDCHFKMGNHVDQFFRIYQLKPLMRKQPSQNIQSSPDRLSLSLPPSEKKALPSHIEKLMAKPPPKPTACGQCTKCRKHKGCRKVARWNAKYARDTPEESLSSPFFVQQEKIAPVKVNALDYEEELRRRKQMKQNALKLLLEKAEKKALASKVVVKEVVKEIDKSGDASKQVWSSGKPKEVVTDEEELIEVVGKVVGAGEAQEFEFGEEAITVEDELLGQDLGEVLQESGSAMVEDCNVKETSCTAGETVAEKRDEHADHQYTLGCPFKVTCAELKFVHKYNLDVHMFKEHEVGEMPDDSLRPKEELVSQATEQEMTNEKEDIGLEFKEPNSNIAERPLSPIIMSSRKRSSLSSPCSVSPKTTCGFNTPSPSLDRRSKALASVITSNQREVCLCR